MLKAHSSFVKQLMAVVDSLLLCGCFVGAHAFISLFRGLMPILDYWMMIIGFIGFYLYFAWTRSLFSILDFTWMKNLFHRIVMIFLSAGVLGAAILYIIPDRYYSRLLYGTFTVLSFALIAAEKLIIRICVEALRRRNRNITPVILFGRGRNATRLAKDIEVHPEWGLRIRKTVDLSITPAEFEELLKNSYVEEVLFCIPRNGKCAFSIDSYLQICESMGRPARVFLNLDRATYFARWEYHRFMERPTFVSHTVELDPDQLIFKRLFDIAGALVGVSALCVWYPFLALGIKLTSPGPVFFKQVRVGRNGKRFIIYKFRSMSADAEERRRELESKNELAGAVFKMRDDPRVTLIGRFMRRLSLDELPQFFNVLKGEMSLVGTRPPTPDEVSSYEKWHHRRMSIKPGITGLWQVSGRNKITDFDEVVRLDLNYIDSWSIWLDIKIIFRTIFVVFQREGAY